MPAHTVHPWDAASCRRNMLSLQDAAPKGFGGVVTGSGTYLFYILLLENHYVLLGVACKDCEHMCASIQFLLVWNVFVINDGSHYFAFYP